MSKENLPVILAIIISIGFISLLWLMAWHAVPSGSHDLLTAMTGVLGTAFTTLIGYFFGSSAGSAKKTELLQDQNSQNVQNNQNKTTSGSIT